MRPDIAPPEPPTALVVDDDSACVLILREILRSEGWEIATADSAQDAVAYLRRHPPPDLMIVDLILPDWLGTDLVRVVRSDPTIAGVPVVVCSGHVGPDDEARARAAGSNGFLPKPFGIDELLGQIARVTAQHGPPTSTNSQ